MLVGGEARKVAQASGVNGRVRVLEPLVDGLKLGEYACRVSVDLVDGGHVALLLVPTQVEAQILLHMLPAVLGVGLRGEVHRRLVQAEQGPLHSLEAVAMEADQSEVVALQLHVAAVRVKTLFHCCLLLFDDLQNRENN